MSDRLHILGICGTFMGGLALLARELGFEVSGSDTNIYPPMSTQLAASGIPLLDGYHAEHLFPTPDQVVVGNALSRGNPVVEAVLDRDLAYTSGPQWLGENVLQQRHVLAVSGTHGKTTTASMLAWILECADMAPGFLIGGVPGNFAQSARLGAGGFFVIEADEYDSAFFDKRSKFIHYRPNTLVINNIEFDHADIFADLTAIETQFHHLVRCVPSNGVIIRGEGEAIDRVLERGVWSPVERFSGAAEGAFWRWRALDSCGRTLEVTSPTGDCATINWHLIGAHNAANAIAAIAAACSVGVDLSTGVAALSQFAGVKRRMELFGSAAGIEVYDDFAHHPTAIKTSLEAMASLQHDGRVLAVIEPRSNTMKMGWHRELLAEAVAAADYAFWYQPNGMGWDLRDSLADAHNPQEVISTTGELIERIAEVAMAGDRIVVMSNGGFDGLHQKLLDTLTESPLA